MDEVALTPQDCTTCPSVVVDGTSYANPCCMENVNVPSGCCENKNFLQGALVPARVAQCWQGSWTLGGTTQNNCLSGVNKCDIASESYLRDDTRAVYDKLGFVPTGQPCEVPINPFEQALAGTAFDAAVNACTPPPPECKEGDSRQVGDSRQFGECTPDVYVCKARRWVLMEKGVRSEIEECDGKDNDCNGEIDDTMACECTPRATQPCVAAKSDAVMTCVNMGDRFGWNKRACKKVWDELDVPEPEVEVVETGSGAFAMKTRDGFGVPCASEVFPYCVIYNKKTDGPVSVVKEFGGVIGGITGAVVLPKGFEELYAYEIDNCDHGDLDVAVNIPPVDGLVAVYSTEEGEVVLPSSLGVQPELSGFDVQRLFDKAEIPSVSYVDVKQGAVLSSVAPSISALGISAVFSGAIEGVAVSVETADVKVRNNARVVLGQQLRMKFENMAGVVDARISAPLVLSKDVDPNSLGLYVYKDGSWEYVGGSVEGEKFVVVLKDIRQYLDNGGMTFMIAGSRCDGCKQAYLFTVRDVNSPVLVVLVHGFYSSPRRSMAALIKEFEDENVNVDVAIFSYSGMPPGEASAALADNLRMKNYEKIVFITHSLGGLIVRKFLYEEGQRADSLIPKVEALIMAAVPNQGTPVADKLSNLFDVFARLLKEEDSAPIAGVHKETLELIRDGLPYPVPDSVKVFALAGTKDRLGIGKLLGVQPPDDAIVSSESVKQVGGKVLTDECVDELSQSVDHFRINKAPENRYTLLYFLRRLSSAFSERAPPQMYAALRFKDCKKGVLHIYGRLMDTSELPPPVGCEEKACGDGVCQLEEVCPVDCPKPAILQPCVLLSAVVYALLLIAIVLTVVYAVRTEKKKQSRTLLYTIYGLTAASLIMFVIHYFVCAALIPAALIVFGLILLILFVDLFARSNGNIRWH